MHKLFFFQKSYYLHFLLTEPAVVPRIALKWSGVVREANMLVLYNTFIYYIQKHSMIF